ncbi:MAG: hypothetical protein H6954_05235 [Chromatiaceae bacterium]|nr:hypothetical protein [Chromatiaceae bacterium]
MSRKLSAGDQIRLLCNAAEMIHEFETRQEVTAPRCKTPGELMLQDALVYLAYGDIHNALPLVERYKVWLRTDIAGWPYDGDDDEDED